MIFINSESRVNSRLFSVIRRHFFNVIRGLRPANLDCRIASGDDYKMERGKVTGLLRCARNDICCLGRSMIEMLGVLAIIGVLSVGGIAGYSKAMTKFKTNQIADQVSTIVTNVKTLYARQKNYKGLNNNSAYLAGVFSEELFASYGYGGYYLTNPFNGSIDISSSGRSATNYDNMTFQITYYGLPKEACISLATNDWSGDGLIAIGAGSSFDYGYSALNTMVSEFGCPVETEFDSGNRGNLAVSCSGPLSPSSAAFACNCEGDTCGIGWWYR